MQKKKIYSLLMAVLATSLFASNASLAKSAHASHANHESSSSAHYSDQGSDRPSGASSSAQEDIPQVPVEVIRPRAEGQKLDAFSVGKAANEGHVGNGGKVDPVDRAVIPASYRLNQSKVIAMKPGENIFVPIAVNHPNRFLTPFKHPQVVSTTLTGGSKKDECGEICIRGNVVYISTEKTFPVTAFITERGREDIALSVTMLPRQVPPREVKLTLPEDVMESLRQGEGKRGIKEAEVWETSQPYVDTLRSAFRDIAKGEVPQGYVLRKVKGSDPVPTCAHPGLSFDFVKGQILEGYNLNFYVGVIENIADSPVEFREQRCGGWRVAAVTSWPLKVLKPGQKTEVYVAVKREEKTPAESVRKPLIEREYN